MEDIRKIGLAYFANLSGEKKEQAEEFLNKMFGSRHEIGFKIYQKFVRREGLSRVDTKGCFKVLDVDGNERLNREEAKPLYYISEINILFTCDICHVILTGSFFSCFQCFSDPSEETFDLCCDCYKNQRFRGRHDHTVFYDNQRLLLNHRDRRQQRKRNDLQLTAEIYYQTIFPDIKDAADKIFLEMDNDKNKKIDEDEYISYMKKKGYPKMANINVFRELNGSGSGQLDSMEVMTLNYIIQCRIPICDGCNIIMDGLYFTCIKCFNDRDDKTFDVCPSCFKKKKYSHKHKKFFDNHSLLQCKRIEAPEEKKRNKRMRAQPSTSTSEQMVSARQQTIRLLSATSSLTGIAASVVTIITSCSIM